MKSSVFRQFLDVRDELGQIAMNHSNIITHLSDPNYVNNTGFNVDGIISKFAGNTMTITAPNGTSSTFAVATIEDSLDEYIPGTSLTLGDYINSVSNTGDLYAQLSAITSKFSYSSRMTLSDLNAIIDGIVVNSLNYDISTLKSQLVAVSDDDGYVSGRSWLISLKNWMRSAYNSADTNSPSLDTTAAFTLAGVYNVIVSVLTLALTAICTALKGIFSTILNIVVSIFKTLFNAINAYFSDEVVLDWNATNSFVKGPICAAVMRPAWYEGMPQYSDFGDTYKILYSESAGIGTFMWRVKDDQQDGLNVNSYLYPCWHPQAVARWVQSNFNTGNFEKASTELIVHAGINGALQNVPSNTDEEAAELCTNTTLIMQSLLVDAFVRWCIETPKDWYMNDDPSRHCTFCGISSCFMSGGTSHGTTSVAARYLNAVEIGGRIVFGILEHSGNPMYLTSLSQIQTVLKDYVQDMNNNMGNPLYETPVHFTSTLSARCVITEANIAFARDISLTGFYQIYQWDPDTNTSSFRTYFRNGSDPGGKLYESNSLPSGKYFITLKSVTLGELLPVLAIGLVVAVASAVTYTLASRAIALKKTQKSALRLNTIQQKREAFLADPSDKTKGLEYAKAVRKYNRLGRMFGWGTYDGVNDWVDTSVSGGSSEVCTGLTSLWANSDATTAAKESIKSSILSAAGVSGYTVEDATTNIESLIGDENGGLVKQLGDVNTNIAGLIGDTDSGLVKQVNDVEDNISSLIGDADSGLVKQVNDVESSLSAKLGDSDSGIVKQINDVQLMLQNLQTQINKIIKLIM